MPTPVVSVSHLGAAALEHRIGVQHQEAQLQKRIKVWEAVDLWFALYAQGVDTEALPDRLSLEAKRNEGPPLGVTPRAFRKRFSERRSSLSLSA